MDAKKPERRWRIYWIDQGLALLLLRGVRDKTFLHLPKTDGIPDDAQVEEVHYAWDRRAFGIVLSSASFDLVEEGEHIPSGDRIVPLEIIKAVPMEGKSKSWRDNSPMI